ncbi:MAG: hypothetical protein Q8P56_02150 [Candidatus Uhrbacteria bacterium]|nr:hypothetical protein [Candidatus Uhrbacteria bacterium]
MKKKIIIIILFIGAVSVSAFFVAGRNWKEPLGEEAAQEEQKDEGNTGTLPVEEARANDLANLNESNSSWPGELASYSLIEVHPLSEGVLTDVRVRVGQQVVKGEVLAIVSPPPASMERADAAAKKMETLTKARANTKATAKVVDQSIRQLLQAKESLTPSRDVSVSVAEKEVEVNRQSSANTKINLEQLRQQKNALVDVATQERDQAKVLVSIRNSQLRAMLEQILNNNLEMITLNYTDYRILDWRKWQIQYKVSSRYGQTRYESALLDVISDLKNPKAEIDATADEYADALKDFIFWVVPNEYIADADIVGLKRDTQDVQKEIIDVVGEYRESKSMLKVKEADLLKMIAERDAEIADASNMIASASKELDTAQEEKKKMGIDSELEYLNRKREIDIKIIELNRDLDLARAEERAAEAGYQTFISGIGPQKIVALKAGVVTSISKNVGDYVMPDQTLASLQTSADANDSFVRFRIPSDAALPLPGDEVVVIRPGFPFEKKKALIIGIGNTLDDNGSFVGEAEFIDEVVWPVRALVRVIPASAGAILVPFNAVRWDEEEKASLRIVNEKGEIEKRDVVVGRAIGDKVEILENLSSGEFYIPILASDEMLAKMKAGIPVPSSSETPAKKGEMDMEGH